MSEVPPLLGKKAVCTTIFPYLHVCAYTCQCNVTHYSDSCDFRGFRDGVRHVMKITTADGNPDKRLLTWQTFCLRSDVPARSNKMQIMTMSSASGDCGFFLACQDFGTTFDHSFPACIFFFFLKRRLACTHQFLSLRQDQSTVVKRAETTVAECSLTSCVWACFQHWIQGACVFRCNLPPRLLAEWPGSFTCHFGNTGVERTRNKSQHPKLILERKILPPLLPGFELATFRSRVERCTNKLSRLPVAYWLTSLLLK